jgi:hypothetical protein
VQLASFSAACDNSARVPGVNVGDWAYYDVSIDFSTNDPSPPIESVPTDNITMHVVSVLNTNVTYESTIALENGTSVTMTLWLDVSSGQASPVGSLPPGVLIAANLSAGDSLSLNDPSLTINSTVLRAHAGALREVNHIELSRTVNSTSFWMDMNYSYYWDRQSGVLTEEHQDVCYTMSKNGYVTSIRISLVLVDTNIWEPSLVPADVMIFPRALNVMSRGRWVYAIVVLPKNCAHVDASSIVLNGTIYADKVFGRRCLLVRFDRKEVVALILSTRHGNCRFGTVTLTITGQLENGETFQGSDTIKIIAPKHRMQPYKTFMRSFPP